MGYARNSRQWRMDRAPQVPGGLYRASLSGRRQRRRLPRDAGAQFLAGVHMFTRGPQMKTATRVLLAALLTATAAVAAPPAAPAAPVDHYVVNDSHFHLTNY